MRVEFRALDKRGTHCRLDLAVEATEPLSPFSLSVADFSARVGRGIGLVSDVEIGDAKFDDRYVVAGDPVTLRRLLSPGALKDAVERLFEERSFDLLEVEAGSVHGQFRTRLDEIVPWKLHGTLVALCRIAELCVAVGQPPGDSER